MIPLFSPEQVRGIDEYAIHQLNIPGILLMENAAMNITRVIKSQYPDNSFHSVAIICGKGNNGGDGFAVARHLFNAGYSVHVLCLYKKEEVSPDAKINLNILEKLVTPKGKLSIRYYRSIQDVKKISSADIVIDAILGSGSRGSLSESLIFIIQFLNALSAKRIAIDIPTGLNALTGYGSDVFNAELTITLAALKQGLFFSDGYRYSGKVEEAEIGVSEEYFNAVDTNTYLIEPEDVLSSLPDKGINQNKSSAGKVLSIAGSLEYPGAGMLCSMAPFYVGAGSSILAFPKSIADMAHNNTEYELIVKKYKDNGAGYLKRENTEELKSKIDWADVVIFGPGLGTNEATVEAVREFLTIYPEKKKIIDADALNALKCEDLKKYNFKNAILTPHVGELARLTGSSVKDIRGNMSGVVRTFCVRHNCHLVLKDFRTLIGNPDGEVFINTTGNQGLAKFGSGDVLSGVIAGLLAQTKDFEKAAIAGVYLHGLTADILKESKTEYGFTAPQLIYAVPETIKFLRDSIV